MSAAALRSDVDRLRTSPVLHPIAELEAWHAVAAGDVTLPDALHEDLRCLVIEPDPADKVRAASERSRRRARGDQRRARSLAPLPERRGRTRSARRGSHGPALLPTPLVAAVDGILVTRSDAALQQAAGLIDRVIAYLAAEGRGPAAAALQAQRDAPRPQAATIVVAGEDKRGKSSLVNALLGAADLSPVGVKVVTGTPLRFVHAEQPAATLHRYGKTDAETVDVDTARRLATVEGNPGNEQNLASITIGLPIDMLRRVTLIDTPGVGGLASGHAALTLQSLHDADALLFLVDATAPIRASELAFLRQASARLQAVVLVVTKTDVHPGWRQILQ